MNSEQKYDVIISGAGPAGATCALFLAKKGRKVLLLDKEEFPRDKVCADNKTWKCLDIVRELGLWEEFEKLPKAEIQGVLVASPSGIEMDTPLLEKDIEEKGPWYNVRREIFDNLLAQASKKNKNIIFLENCSTIGPIIESGKVVGVEYLKGKKTELAFAKVTVAAEGSASPIATKLGLDAKIKGRYAVNARAYYEGVSNVSNRCELYYLNGICPGYFWIFPVDNDQCNVGIGMRLEDIQKMRMTLEEKMLSVIEQKFSERFGRAKRKTEIKKWGVSVLGGRRKWSGDGFLLIGDAGTFAMTFSGEGVGPAMRSGKIAAQTINEAIEKNDFSEKSLAEFDKTMWKVLEPEIKGFKWLEFLILHKNVYDWVVKKSVNNKEMKDIRSRMQREYSVAQELISPKILLKILFS